MKVKYFKTVTGCINCNCSIWWTFHRVKNIKIVPEIINPTDSVYFRLRYQPIFTANCVSCHGAIKAPDLRDGYSYKALTEGGYVNPPASRSKLYKKMTSCRSYFQIN